MAEKSKFLDGITLRRGLSKFDTPLLTNDGGKYSPSIRRLKQNYFYDTKCFTNKLFSSPTQSSLTTKQLSERISDPQLSSSNHHHHQSSIDLLVTSLKCDHCHKNEGLFQCCHCNQRLCIRCCNKHYKKVTAECEHIHELSNSLVTKIIHKKSEIERQKKETIEQCHKWRIDTINAINQAHKLVIQTIYDEYELLNKQYEVFIQKEMSHINIAENELVDIEKRNLISLLLPSYSSPITTTINPIKSIDSIKQHIESLTKDIDEKSKFSLQVKLPLLDINNNLKVESHFSDNIKIISAIWQNDDFIDDMSFSEWKEISKKSSDSPSIVTNTNDASNDSSIEQN